MASRGIRIVSLLMLFAGCSYAGTPPLRQSSYDTALITRMRMVRCAEPPRHGNLFQNFVIGAAPPIPMGAAECPEYEIEAPKVFYRIRPRRDILLPVGEEVRFRIHKRDLLVLTEDTDKEIVFSVIEMTLKSKLGAQERIAEQAREGRARKCLTMEGEIVECSEK